MTKKRKSPRKHTRKKHLRKGKKVVKHSVGKKPFKPMPKVFHLPLETAVYVPSTKFDKKVPDKEFRKRIAETRKKLSELFGGYTSIKAIGGFISDKKGLIKEDVIVVISFAENKSFLKNRTKLKNWLIKKKKDWKQESIGFEFENDLYYL